MTEDEAKTKWCPFARTLTVLDSGDTLPPANRLSVAETILVTGDPLSPEACRCIGSACMAWREKTSFRGDTCTETVSGFCGLAGAPS